MSCSGFEKPHFRNKSPMATSEGQDTRLVGLPDISGLQLHQEEKQQEEPLTQQDSLILDEQFTEDHEATDRDTNFDCEAWIATGDISCSGAVAGSDVCLPRPPIEHDRFICGNYFQDQVNFHPFRVLQLHELAEPPFNNLFEDIGCLDQIPDHFLITPFGIYRAILEAIEAPEQTDQVLLTALISRFGTIPDLIEDEDVIYPEDMEPCMCDDNGKPLDIEYWAELHELREFWSTIPGGREYQTIDFSD